MKTITIQIPEMQSSHCQMRVNKAIATVNGTVLAEIKPGVAVVRLENETQQQNVINAINQAGYKTLIENKVPADGEVFYFKTNIKCGGCVSKVSTNLNAAEGISHWDVNTNSPDKILTVQSAGISRETIISTVKNAGFEIELINP